MERPMLSDDWKFVVEKMKKSKVGVLKDLAVSVEYFDLNERYNISKSQLYISNENKIVDAEGKVQNCVDSLRFEKKETGENILYYTRNIKDDFQNNETSILMVKEKNGVLLKRCGKDRNLFSFKIDENKISHFKEVNENKKENVIKELI